MFGWTHSWYCNKRVIFLIYTLIFLFMLKILHARFVHMYINSETLEPLTWIRVRPSHRYAHTLSLPYCFVSRLSNISKYTTCKPITQLVLSYIQLATYLTLLIPPLHANFTFPGVPVMVVSQTCPQDFWTDSNFWKSRRYLSVTFENRAVLFIFSLQISWMLWNQGN